MNKGEEIPRDAEMPPEPKYTPEDYEATGRELLKVDPTLARAYLRASNLPKAEINNLIDEAQRVKSAKETKKMGPEEKKDLWEKMAEEFEEKAKKIEELPESEKNETTEKNKKEYQKLARAYHREIEEIEKKKKG